MAVTELAQQQPQQQPISDRKLARKLRRISNAKTLGNNMINAALIEFNKQNAQARGQQNGNGANSNAFDDNSGNQQQPRPSQRVTVNARVHVQADPNSNNIMLTVETPNGTFSSYV